MVKTFKKVSLMLMPFMLLACGGGQQKESNQTDGNETAMEKNNFTLKSGVNVSHWLSQSGIRGEERAKIITKADFDSIAAMGFDHVRLPIDEEQMYDTAMNREPEAFALMHNAINWALENKMRIIVDLHIVRSHHFNGENENPNNLFQEPKEQEKIINIWRDLQSDLMSLPVDSVAYELLNEAVAPTNEDWNLLLNRICVAIREKEPNRTLVIGANMWQTVQNFKDLRVPENDPNLILSFHYYEPSLITHYRAHWDQTGAYEGPVNYPGVIIEDTSVYKNYPEEFVVKLRERNYGEWNAERIEQNIQLAIDKTTELGLQLYCGEYGAYPRYIDPALRLKWYEDVISVFRKHNIASAHWCYKGDFPVVKEDGSANEVAAIITSK